ncbi:hypothetical protein SLS58_007170 [Diplodia intermedia]|uniref:FAD-binding domain-containing protein n=1 Tax=Diplodia intermedia TaxID=856260 RepID=A0ABR3TKZ8_9PEZI
MEDEIPHRFFEKEKKPWQKALSEFFFNKWHFQRIITIGDAAHKFSPISGQGGNSAIESAAVLATELIDMLKALPDKTSPSDEQITTAFQETQDRRRERLIQMSLMVLETPLPEFVATHIIPFGGMEGTFEHFATAAFLAERLPMLPMTKRPRFEPYLDQRPAKPLGSVSGTIPKAIAAAVFAALLILAKKAMAPDPDLIPATRSHPRSPPPTSSSSTPSSPPTRRPSPTTPSPAPTPPPTASALRGPLRTAQLEAIAQTLGSLTRDMELHKNFLDDSLDINLKTIRQQREELDQREAALIAMTKKEDAEKKKLVGSLLEDSVCRIMRDKSDLTHPREEVGSFEEISSAGEG